MNTRFDEMLPWYVNGTLGAEDRAQFEAHLAADPQARAEVEWYRSLARRMQDNAPKVPETIGLSQVLSRIGAERPNWSQRISGFLGSLVAKPGVAFAGLALIVAQSGVILHLAGSQQDEASELRAVSASPTAEGPLLKINFAPDARESDIRHLLISVQGRLVGGPGQLGDYFVAVPAGKEAALAEQLKTHPAVQAVSLAPGLPPKE
jgi:hypothetical protein